MSNLVHSASDHLIKLDSKQSVSVHSYSMNFCCKLQSVVLSDMDSEFAFLWTHLHTNIQYIMFIWYRVRASIRYVQNKADHTTNT